MITLALAATLCAVVATPHLVRLDDASPVAGAVIWLSALALRALTMVAVALYVALVLPTTALLSALSHWCWDTALPLLAAHLGVDGHRLADVAVVLPAFVLTASVISVGFGVLLAARRLAQLLRGCVLGPDPADTVVIGGNEVLVAAAGFHRPRVLVSTGALIGLDDEGLGRKPGSRTGAHRATAPLRPAAGRAAAGARALRVPPGAQRRRMGGRPAPRSRRPGERDLQGGDDHAALDRGGDRLGRWQRLAARREPRAAAGSRSAGGRPVALLAVTIALVTLLAAAADDERAAPAPQPRRCQG